MSVSLHTDFRMQRTFTSHRIHLSRQPGLFGAGALGPCVCSNNSEERQEIILRQESFYAVKTQTPPASLILRSAFWLKNLALTITGC